MTPALRSPVSVRDGRCVSRLLERIGEHAASTPHALAVQGPGGTFTYAALWAEAGERARVLTAAGVRPGDVVVIVPARDRGWIATLLAIWQAGAVYTPVDASSPRTRIETIAARCKARLTITGDRLDLPSPLPGGPSHPASKTGTLDGVAYLMHTSGTTGTPRAVIVSHEALTARVIGLPALYGITRTDRVAQLASPSFDASLWQILLPLLAGATVVLATGALAGPLLKEFLAAGEVTVLNCTPSVLTGLGDLPEQVRLVVCGGEELPAPLALKWSHRVQLANAYGPTEAVIEAIVAPDLGSLRAQPPNDVSSTAGQGAGAPIGAAVAGTGVLLLDADRQPVTAEQVGEIYLTGPALASGYLTDEEATADRFPLVEVGGVRVRAYRTGDLAVRGSGDWFTFAGRTDRQINLRGIRVEPGEIEAAILTLPGIVSAVVVPVQSAHRTILVAHVVTADGAGGAEVHAALAARLPRHAVPAIVVVRDALPLTVNGKTDLAALAAEPLPPIGPGHAPTGEGERQVHPLISGLWQSLTGNVPSPNSHFLTCGGDSLAAARLVFDFTRTTGAALTLEEFLADPTVALLTERLTDK